jgi:hypothetical protein
MLNKVLTSSTLNSFPRSLAPEPQRCGARNYLSLEVPMKG